MDKLQIGYAFLRYGLTYMQEKPLSDLGHEVSQTAKHSLFALDVIDTMYVGWQIQKELQKQQDPSNKKRFYADLAVRGALLIGAAALFITNLNKIIVPKLDLKKLLESTTIPKETLNFITKESLDAFTATWTKTRLESLVSGLFFIRTILDIYLAYLTSQKQPLIKALVHAATFFRTCPYQTIEIRHNFSYLFQTIDYTHTIDPIYSELSEKFFAVPIKKVEAIFHINSFGLSKEALTNKLEQVYNYSSKMFQNSDWHRHWLAGKERIEYFMNVIPPLDQGSRLLKMYSLIYEASLKAGAPPAPVWVRLLHEDKIWKPFLGIDPFRLIPRFAIPAGKVPFSSWIDVQLDLPRSQLNSYLHKIKKFFVKTFLG